MNEKSQKRTCGRAWFLAFALVLGLGMTHVGGAQPAHADQVPFGPVIGRTNDVTVDRYQYGNVDTRISLNTRVPSSAAVYDFTVETFAFGDTRSTLLMNVPAATSSTLHYKLLIRSARSTGSMTRTSPLAWT